MPINRQYHTWICRRQRITQVRNFTWLLVGIHQSRSVTLSKIAGKIPGEAKLLSTVRRLGRFLSNPAIRVRVWYEPIARAWLAALRQLHSKPRAKLLVGQGLPGSQPHLPGQPAGPLEAG